MPQKHAGAGMQADFDLAVQACKTHDEVLVTMRMLKSRTPSRKSTLLSANAEATETHARKVGHAHSDYALLQRLTHKMQSLLPSKPRAMPFWQLHRQAQSHSILRQNTV